MYEERLPLDYKIASLLSDLIGFAKTSGCTNKELEERIKTVTDQIISLTK